jgi:hypothetical protein
MSYTTEGSDYKETGRILQTGRHHYGPSQLAAVVSEPNTSSWYSTNWGCLRTDPTAIAQKHLFSDAALPRRTLDPGPDVRVCGLQYNASWPMEERSSDVVVDMEMSHPQFAFTPGGPATPYQIEVESQLRRLDQPLTRCQAVIPMDAPLFKNTVAPPPPVNVPIGPQNAANPIAVIVRPGGEGCRQEADSVAITMSGRWIGNPTRYDTMRMNLPFAPPGVGSGAPAVASLPIKPIYGS